MTIAKKSVIVFFFVLFLILAFLPILAAPKTVRADDTLFNSQVGLNEVGRLYGNQKQDVRVITAKIVNVVLGFLGAIFFVLTLYAGFQYMTSGGNEEKIKKAVSLLKNAIIGLVIVMLAWVITRYVVIITNRAINNAVDYTHYGPGL